MWLKPDSTADGQSFLGKHTDTGNNIFLMGYWDNGYEVAVRNGYYSSVGTGAKTADYQHLVAVVKKLMILSLVLQSIKIIKNFGARKSSET